MKLENNKVGGVLHRPKLLKTIFSKRKNQFQSILNKVKDDPALERKMKNKIKNSTLSNNKLRQELVNMLPPMIEFSENNSVKNNFKNNRTNNTITKKMRTSLKNYSVENQLSVRNYSSNNSSFINSPRTPLRNNNNLYPEPNALSELDQYKQLLNKKSKELEKLLKFKTELNKNREDLKLTEKNIQNKYNRFIREHQEGRNYMNFDLLSNIASFQQGKREINKQIKNKQNEINKIEKNLEKIFNKVKNLEKTVNQLEEQRNYLLKLEKNFGR